MGKKKMEQRTHAPGVITAGKLERVDKWYLFIVAAVILSYCMYLPMHYGMDTFACENLYRMIDSTPEDGRFAAVMGEAIGSGFSAGRYTRGAMFLLFALVGKAEWLIQPWVNVVAVFFMCLAACTAWKMLKEHNAVNNKMVFPCLLVAFCQPFFTDWLQFSECQIYYPLGLYLAVMAAKMAFRPCEKQDTPKGRGAVQWLIGLVLLLLAAGLYQITMQWFVLFTVIVVVLESICHSDEVPMDLVKKVVKKACWGVSIYGVTALVQLLFTRVLFQNTRVNEAPFLQRVEIVLQAQRTLWRVTPYTGNLWSLLFLLLVALLAVLVVVSVVKSRVASEQKTLRILIALICAVAFHTSIFLPLLFSELWFPQRSLVGFWGIPLLLAVAVGEYPARKKDSTFGVDCTTVVAFALAAVNVFICISFGRGLYRVNEIDLARAQQIENTIVRYEQINGQNVEYLAFHHDYYPMYGYPGIFFAQENNGAAWSRSWNFLSLMRKVSGKDYQQVEYSDERFFEIYGAANWNEFDVTQIVVDGNTAYIVVY